jgi:hypothetical protein
MEAEPAPLKFILYVNRTVETIASFIDKLILRNFCFSSSAKKGMRLGFRKTILFEGWTGAAVIFANPH